MDHNTPEFTPEEAKALAAAYQNKVMAELFGFLTLTGNTFPTSPTTNEKETPDSRLN